MPWVRVGDCPPEHCRGRCCTHLGLWLQSDDDTHREWAAVLQTRGVSVKSLTDEEGTEHLLADIPQVCQFLTPDGLCALYGKPERPDFCERWPEDPQHLLAQPDCLYRFEWVEDDEKEIAHG